MKTGKSSHFVSAYSCQISSLFRQKLEPPKQPDQDMKKIEKIPDFLVGRVPKQINQLFQINIDKYRYQTDK